MNESNPQQQPEFNIEVTHLIEAYEERLMALTKENLMLTAALKQMGNKSTSKPPHSVTPVPKTS